jgi:hypothetical protein
MADNRRFLRTETVGAVRIVRDQVSSDNRMPKTFKSVLFTLLLMLGAGLPELGNAAAEISKERVKEIAAALPDKPAGVGRPITDRAAWEKLARNPRFAATITDAEAMAKTPVEKWSDEIYLEFFTTGRRSASQSMQVAPLSRAQLLTLAECLENRGRFIAPVEEAIAVVCAQPTWVYAAHDQSLATYSNKSVHLDLSSTRTAWSLATVNHMLGDKLSVGTRKLIRENLERRALKPFRDMVEGRREENTWLRRANNWNAVCLAGLTGTALATLDSREDRAWFIAAAQHYVPYFLASFPPDGYCTEGVGYWNYGYGHYVLLSETVRRATGGKVDFFTDPKALEPALFGERTEIINGIYPTISDVSPGSEPAPDLTHYVFERLGLPESRRSASQNTMNHSPLLFSVGIFAFPETLPRVKNTAASESPLRTWFKDGGVLICRTAPEAKVAFGAALKGGIPGESHNHNDEGSFSVVAGKTMLICDPGAEVYTRKTFGSSRYKSKVMNSYGHAVPVVAGKMQRPGDNVRIPVLRTDFRDAADTLVLNLAVVYPVPSLKKLERGFTFTRGAKPSLTVQDVVEFSGAETFETALVTWGKWEKISDTELRLSDGADAVRVKIDAGGEPLSISHVTLDEEVRTPRQPVRIGIALKSPVKKAVVTMRITPE